MAFPRIEGYVVTEKLGSGSYSTVYKAYNKVGGRMTVAIKCVQKCRVKHSGAAVDNLITEIRLLKALAHPHIVKMHNFTWDDQNIYIIMEYCCGGDLSKFIKKYGRVPETQVRYFLQQLASALKFLYEKGVIHMDLKPHNLLLHKESNGKYILKVADFGFAQHMCSERGPSPRGSPLYMAPEALAGERGAGRGAGENKGDLWSVGVIMYECLFGVAPYSSATLAELVDKVQRRAPIQIPRNSSISPECHELLRSLLQHDPARRISYEEFFAHHYLDLEHMPSPENYEKAVSLIQRAVTLDSAGELAAALDHYTRALRLLVPRLARERGGPRGPALARKLTTYMERAEEIKLYLQGGAPTQGRSPRGDAETPRPVACDCPPNYCQCGTRTEHPPVPENVTQTNDQPASAPAPAHAPAHAPTTRRFALGRLFGRQSSLPLLDDKDTNDISGPSHAQKDSENDACRIS